MNFYKRHIGDYLKDTSHLSLLEHGIYSRLLDVYYTRESAIPDEAAQRLIGARSKDEIKALNSILNEFFVLRDNAWYQTRCESEISSASDKADRNRESGKKGGRPRKTDNPEITQVVSELKPTNNQDGSKTEPTNNPSQTPDSRLQTPDTKTEKQNLNPKAAHSTLNNHEPDPEPIAPLVNLNAEIKPAPETPKPEKLTEAPSLAGAMAGELRRRGVSVTSQDPRLRAWIEKGVTIPMAVEAFEIARQRKPAPAPIPTGYLDVIIENEVLNPKPKKNLGPQWWSSEQATNAKAAELGMTAGGGESWESYRGRIRQRIAETERKSA